MNKHTINCRGIELNVELPSTIEELVAFCGSEAEVVKRVNNQVLFHSIFTKLRAEHDVRVGASLGLERFKDASGKLSETSGEFTKRVEKALLERGADEDSPYAETAEILADVWDTVIAPNLAKFYSASVRTSGALAKPTKKALAYFAALVEQGKLEAFAEKHGLTIETTDEDEEDALFAGYTNETVSTACAKIRELVRAAEEAAAKAALSALS